LLLLDGVVCLGKAGLELQHIAAALDLLNLTFNSAGHLVMHLCLGLDALGTAISQSLHLHLQVRNLLLSCGGIRLGFLHLLYEVNLLFDQLIQVLNLRRSTSLLVLDGLLQLPQQVRNFGAAW